MEKIRWIGFYLLVGMGKYLLADKASSSTGGGTSTSGAGTPAGGVDVDPAHQAQTLPSGGADLAVVARNVIDAVIFLVAIVAVAGIIRGAILVMLARGDTGKVAQGKNAILYAVTGLLIALLSFAIVNFVLIRI